MPELHLVSTPESELEQHASALVGALREHFNSGATKPLAWRLSQLDALEHFMMERDQDITDALRADLGKPHTEAFTSEAGIALSAISSGVQPPS